MRSRGLSSLASSFLGHRCTTLWKRSCWNAPRSPLRASSNTRPNGTAWQVSGPATMWNCRRIQRMRACSAYARGARMRLNTGRHGRASGGAGRAFTQSVWEGTCEFACCADFGRWTLYGSPCLLVRAASCPSARRSCSHRIHEHTPKMFGQYKPLPDGRSLLVLAIR